jgi:hypothetical protein
VGIGSRHSSDFAINHREGASLHGRQAHRREAGRHGPAAWRLGAEHGRCGGTSVTLPRVRMPSAPSIPEAPGTQGPLTAPCSALAATSIIFSASPTTQLYNNPIVLTARMISHSQNFDRNAELPRWDYRDRNCDRRRECQALSSMTSLAQGATVLRRSIRATVISRPVGRPLRARRQACSASRDLRYRVRFRIDRIRCQHNLAIRQFFRSLS